MASEAALREYYIDQIQHQGFVSVEFGIHEVDTDRMFATFTDVLDEIYGQKTQHGQDVIDAFAVYTPGRMADSKAFIEQRRIGEISIYEGRAPGTDNKDLMHFTPLSSIHVEEYLRTRGGMSRGVKQLIEQCSAYHEAVKTSVRPVFRSLGLEDFLIAPEGQELENIHLLRLIRYIGSRATSEDSVFIARDELAELHLDRAKITAAGPESHPGLVGAPANNALGDPNLTIEQLDAYAERALASPIEHHPGRIKIFAGAGYNHMPEIVQEASGNLQPLLHGVTDEVPIGEVRTAAPFFMNQTARFNNWGTPPISETGFSDIRAAVAARQLRHGGLVA